MLLGVALWADDPTVNENPFEWAVPQVTEDTDTVEVPIHLMQQALWYYEMYFIEKARADRLETIVDKWESSSEVFIQEMDEIAKKAFSLEAILPTVKVVSIVLGTYLIIKLGVDVLNIFVK